MIENLSHLSAGQHHSLPLVTVGLPVYNRPEGLRKVLESISAQTYPNIEVIISDNCSPNREVGQIANSFASHNNRIRVYRQTENLGLEGNFNFVYTLSNAPYFIWMSDDDFFEPDYIEKCVSFLENHHDYVLCSGMAQYYAKGKFVFTEPMFKVDQATVTGRLFCYFQKVQKNGNFYGVFRKTVLSDLPLAEHVGCDWSFMAKMAIAGKMTYLENTAYHRSAEGNSQTRKKMTERYGLRGIKNLFFETYLAYKVASNIFTDKSIKAKVGWFSRKLIWLMIFLQINWKLLLKFLRKLVCGKK